MNEIAKILKDYLASLAVTLATFLAPFYFLKYLPILKCLFWTFVAIVGILYLAHIAINGFHIEDIYAIGDVAYLGAIITPLSLFICWVLDVVLKFNIIHLFFFSILVSIIIFAILLMGKTDKKIYGKNYQSTEESLIKLIKVKNELIKLNKKSGKIFYK